MQLEKETLIFNPYALTLRLQGIDSAIATKVAKAGDTLTGDFIFTHQDVDGSITLSYEEVTNIIHTYGVEAIDGNLTVVYSETSSDLPSIKFGNTNNTARLFTNSLSAVSLNAQNITARGSLSTSTLYANTGHLNSLTIYNDHLLIHRGKNIKLRAANSSTDPGDIIFEDGAGNELGRIWNESGSIKVRIDSTNGTIATFANASTTLSRGNFVVSSGNITASGNISSGSASKTTEQYVSVTNSNHSGSLYVATNGTFGIYSATQGVYLIYALSGDTTSLYTNRNIYLTSSSRGIYGRDTSNTTYPLIYSNSGNNLWIGAISSDSAQHVGGTYITSGYNSSTSTGNRSIYVSVPNATNTGASLYEVFHTNNYTNWAVAKTGSTMSGILKMNNASIHLYGTTIGNSASSMKSGTAGLFSWGDTGPQITFDTSATPGGSQAGAIIYTDNDIAGTGVSWHFVSNQADWTVTSKRFHARTSISIGSDLPNTTRALYVNGTEQVTGGLLVGSTLTAYGSIVLSNTSLTKGTAPSSDVSRAIGFTDKDGWNSLAADGIGVIYCGVTATNQSYILMRVIKAADTTNQTSAQVYLSYPATGSPTCTISTNTNITGSLYATTSITADGSIISMNNYNRRHTTLVRGTAPSTAQYMSYNFVDKDYKVLSVIQYEYDANGTHGLNIAVTTPDSTSTNTYGGIYIRKTTAGVTTVSITGATTISASLTANSITANGNIIATASDTTERTVRASNSLGNVYLDMAASGNHGIYSGVKSGWLIYATKDSNDTNSIAYIPRALTVSGVLTNTSYLLVDRSSITFATGSAYTILNFKYKNPNNQIKTVNVIRGYGDNETAANNGIVLIGSSSGATILTAGESAPSVVYNENISNNENIYCIADGEIYFYVNANTATAAVKAVGIGTSGTLHAYKGLDVVGVAHISSTTTVDGALITGSSFTTKGSLLITNPNVTKGTTPSAEQSRAIVFTDKDGWGSGATDLFGAIYCGVNTSNNSFLDIRVLKAADTANYAYKSIYLSYPATGDPSCTIGMNTTVSGTLKATSTFTTNGHTVLANPGLTKGTAPSAETNKGIAFTDKNGLSTFAGNAIGAVFGGVTTANASYMLFRVIKAADTSNQTFAQINLTYPASGSATCSISMNTNITGTLTASSYITARSNLYVKSLETTNSTTACLRADNYDGYIGIGVGDNDNTTYEIFSGSAREKEVSVGMNTYKLYLRYSTAYLNGTATTITSDRLMKKDFTLFDDRYNTFFMNLKPQMFKMLTGTSGRLHSGFVAQDVEDALKIANINSQDFGGLVIDNYIDRKGYEGILDYDPYEGVTKQYYLRYEEFIALNTYMIQKNVINLRNHESRLVTLERENIELKAEIAILKEQLSQQTA